MKGRPVYPPRGTVDADEEIVASDVTQDFPFAYEVAPQERRKERDREIPLLEAVGIV